MTKFEQIKQNQIAMLENKIQECQKSIETWKKRTIDNFVEDEIQHNEQNGFTFVFRQDPHESISMFDYNKLVEIVKLWYSQEVNDND